MTGLTTGAVCVYHDMVETAVAALAGSGIPVAAVSAGFPAGLSPFHLRIAEIGEASPPVLRNRYRRQPYATGNWPGTL
jgi:deoxyribose-phosphate aldolase